MPLKRMDNVLIVVDDLEAMKAFFIALGLTLEGQTTVEGPEIGNLIGLGNVRAPWRCCAHPMAKPRQEM
ncbi:hypothetical protein [Pseudomonas brassicacearum]|uniref:hypothetical protein n=1 Tax=Pseudomonas brassicacearum TaxID=930166 RepID=UPI002181FDA3|nr:hypothetical protein [Pseudomonas brassicacearum]